jgi:hypothetical protein
MAAAFQIVFQLTDSNLTLLITHFFTYAQCKALEQQNHTEIVGMT